MTPSTLGTQDPYTPSPHIKVFFTELPPTPPMYSLPPTYTLTRSLPLSLFFSASPPSPVLSRPLPSSPPSPAQLLTPRSAIYHSHGYNGKVQDAYCLRCAPQVHGIVHDTVKWVHSVLSVEMNSATDNPMIFTGEPDLPDEMEDVGTIGDREREAEAAAAAAATAAASSSSSPSSPADAEKEKMAAEIRLLRAQLSESKQQQKGDSKQQDPSAPGGKARLGVQVRTERKRSV